MLYTKRITYFLSFVFIGLMFSTFAYGDAVGLFQPPKTDEELARQNTVNAPLIILCTNIPGLDSEVINNFTSSVFADIDAPLVLTGNHLSSTRPEGTVYFYFDLFEKDDNYQWNEECLKQFPEQPSSYADILDVMSRNLGQVPSFLPNAGKFEPIAMKLKTILDQDGVVFLVLGDAGTDLPVVKLGILELFGLSPDFCDSRSVCPESLNNIN